MCKIKLYCLLPIVLLLIGCAASGPIYQAAPPPENEKALIYIYRPNTSYALGGRSAYIYIDSKNIVDIDRGGYSYTYVNPGSHIIKQKWPIDLIGFKDTELAFSAEANNSYYFKFGVSGGCPEGTYNEICWRWVLEQMTEDLAKPELIECRHQPSR